MVATPARPELPERSSLPSEGPEQAPDGSQPETPTPASIAAETPKGSPDAGPGGTGADPGAGQQTSAGTTPPLRANVVNAQLGRLLGVGEHVQGDGRLVVTGVPASTGPEIAGELMPWAARSWVIPTVAFGVPVVLVVVALGLQAAGAALWLRPIRRFSGAVVLRTRLPGT